VIAAFELSWQELSAGTAKVAMLLGLFEPAYIAWGLVEEVSADLIDAGDLREGRKQLNNLYLIKAVDQDRTRFAMHLLTRQFLQWKLAQDLDTNRLFRETFVMSLQGIYKQIPQLQTEDQIAEVVPAVLQLGMLSIDDIFNRDENINLIGDILGVGIFFQRKLNDLAMLYDSQGRYEEAETIYQQVTGTSQELGDLHPFVAPTLNNLAMLYDSQGRYEKAEPLYIRALAMMQELFGDRHPHVASILNNLAGLYDSQGRYEEAEPLYRKALEILEVALGKEHPTTKVIRNNLQSLRDLQN
jgi:tetratricopeptide (TPR) repeat protein